MASQSTTENTYRRTISFSIFSTTARGWPEDARDLLLVWRYSFCSHVVKKSWWKTANQLQKCRFCDHQYLIQPQASQINVRHVGSLTYGNFSLLRRMSKITEITDITDKLVTKSFSVFQPSIFGIHSFTSKSLSSASDHRRSLAQIILRQHWRRKYFAREKRSRSQCWSSWNIRQRDWELSLTKFFFHLSSVSTTFVPDRSFSTVYPGIYLNSRLFPYDL